MYARVGVMQSKTDKLEEGIRIFQEGERRMRSVTGYKGGWLFVNRQSNKAVSISLWESEQDSAAYANSPLRDELIAPLADIVEGQPTVDVFEVIVQP